MQNSSFEDQPKDLFSPSTPPPLPSPFNKENQTENWQGVQTFTFSGSTSEYFGIWIVNILLTIITIGFYSPWAKVRRLRYFYGCTQFINRRFDFTGIPSRILIGRLIAFGIYFTIAILSEYSVTIAIFGFLFIYLAAPWLVCATLRFRGRNSKFGNSRFYFSGTNKQAYIEFLKGVALVICTFGLAFPVLVWLYKRYFFDHLYVGQLKFKMNADWPIYVGAMYVPLLACICLFSLLIFGAFIFGGVISAIGVEGMIFIGFTVYFLCIAFIWPWMSARLFIATWNNTSLSESQFKTNSNEYYYAWIVMSNWIVKILTLGLMTPWAAIRLYKYQAESISLELNNDPNTMINRLQNNPIGIGEEIADVFDFDISL
ncbi:YjgN family protein [Acinetobacter equi]|uniref:Uncharacterized protein n=1 Tax=Acinetobacter equi TaxID=1324350 RepID=A0A0N7GXB5_9GAMM|nr:YjgN family protein [Acinetobacter equi]ALH94251.1 hypothetical protein AOY20_01105 [Acinetobacter equi]